MIRGEKGKEEELKYEDIKADCPITGKMEAFSRKCGGDAVDLFEGHFFLCPVNYVLNKA